MTDNERLAADILRLERLLVAKSEADKELRQAQLDMSQAYCPKLEYQGDRLLRYMKCLWADNTLKGGGNG